MTQELLSVSQAAKRTALAEHSIRKGIKDGSIAARKMGRDWFLAPPEVERLAREYPLD